MSSYNYAQPTHHPYNVQSPYAASHAHVPGPGVAQPFHPAGAPFGHDQFGHSAPAWSAPAAPVSHAAMYEALNQTKTDIKSIRGWHGSNLAVAGGIVGGVLLAAGAAAAFVLTGGTAAISAGAMAVGAGVAVGGGAAGTVKTMFGKRECKKNEQLMEKIVVLTQIRKELKANKAMLDPQQRQLYRDIKKVTKKVDRGTLAEASVMAGRTVAGVAGGAASILVIAAIGAAGESAGSQGCFCWGPGPVLGVGPSGASIALGDGTAQSSGVRLTPEQVTKLKTPLAP